MVKLNLEKTLQKKLETFASANNIQIEELIESILYEYIDDIEEKNGPLLGQNFEEDDGYNPEDVSFLANALGLNKKYNN